jgi:hypothetical protein
MSLRIPTLRTIGPEAAYEIASYIFREPTPTNLDFQILLVVRTAKTSVRDLKQSRVNNTTSKKNW